MVDNINTYIIIFSSIGLLIIASVWVLLSDWFKQKRINLVQKIRVKWISIFTLKQRKMIKLGLNIILLTTVIIILAFGLYYDYISWDALILPAIFLSIFYVPYIWGIIVYLWIIRRESGRKSLNFKDLSTFEIMLTVLKTIGCKPTVYEDELLSVQYQGENFYMEFGGRYARIWNLGWALIKADDPDLPNIHEAVNATNSNFGPNVILNTSEKEGIIELNSKWDIMLHPACPNNDYYVKAVLDSFFSIKDEIFRNIQQINAQQIEKQKNRRPVGFTTTQKEEEQQQ